MAEPKEKREVEIIINGQKANASLKEMDAAVALMYNQLRKMASDDPNREKLKQDFLELKDKVNDVRTELKGAAESSSFLSKAMQFAGIEVGVEAAVDGVKELVSTVIETTKEVGNLRSNINGLTGATGADLDQLTTSVMAVSRTFGKEFNEVLQAANTLSKQMGISQQDAMKLIEQGFEAGADASGEFLDQVKEYAPQFKNAGYSANEFIGHISQSVTTGVFSDKGADVVKEFGLRIREQTKATGDAMQAAFGSEFTKKIFDGINAGSISSAQALQMVAQEMNDTKVPASQLQTVIADVFGGPGEDAGIEYLKSLKNAGKGIDELVDKTNVYTARQIAQLESEKELAAAQNELAKSFEGGSQAMTTLTNEAMTVLYTLLVSLGATFSELMQPVKEVWGAFIDLGRELGIFSEKGLTAKDVGQAIGDVIRFIFAPTKLLWGAIADVVKATVEWAKQSDSAKGYLKLLISPVQAFFDLLKNGPAYFAGFTASADSSFSVVSRAIKKALTGDFSGAKAEFGSFGKNAADEFNKAFAAAAAKKTVVEMSANVKSGGAAPTPELRAAGGDGVTDADRAKAEQKTVKDAVSAAKKLQDLQNKADQARLDSIKAQVKHEEDVEDLRIAAISDKRQREIARINEDARRKAALVTGSEQEIAAQQLAINEERERKLQELADKYIKEGEAKNKARMDTRLAEEDAAEQGREAEIQTRFEAALISEGTRDQLLYEAKHASLEAKLQLEEMYAGKTSTAYLRTNKELEKLDKDHNKQLEENTKKREEAKAQFTKLGLQSASSALQVTIDILGRDENARKKNASLIKAFTASKILIDGVEEVAAIWKNSNSNPLNILIPGAGTALAIAQTALAAVRTGFALSQVKSQQFAKGGATGSGMPMPSGGIGSMAIGPLGNLMELSGMSVGANGKVVDDTGFAVAGVVHEDEYVIPKWMRADPKVMQVENWLEARRLRGYAEGGATSDGDRQATAGDALPGTTDAVVQERMLSVLDRLDSRLASVEDWQRNLKVHLNTRELDETQSLQKQVEFDNAIR
ncbi:phage tail tape measure protein [Hymenobacter crusticola]|uniref:Phage tail tape measure protein domain-containing protein n=1 Tax=Hymenobacter crusticola TaxID=1770526 RepID=A0A243W686_9BACT|nr:phage tail tape measure protein [Hymenobacter crusticola]OUJ69131.1 hypothetical protein BXP70_26980 [Hymenobacter crusticola]